ncbi:filamentation induced by cAMP protein Fic [Cellulomonas flavigena DSM 20109]|uniref:Filamentation induced by cAMP protein Fic n=1 Tax=Cellulomonas flavigena (strain ATCC 482 / DSM 20109 / BCRC 11376 / JCM 18109 / NBRC 3775 / NCIMB 8073 / NRS 134) TaxID=446466 RepID=D5UG90_CELFN|nr:Fic family protein [Cellulomonas flavigena]ADG73073.1 filamentation induced by cAMP protein Fic [Cellulomonas flavigena DSM 20109]
MTDAETTRTFPVHTRETLPWVPASGRRAEIPTYDAAIPPLIADLRVTVGGDTIEHARAAAVEVAVLERNHAGQVTTLEPFLLRTEAIASSRIEEELTTVDQLARAQLGIRAPRTARTVKGAIDGLTLMIDRSGDGVDLADILAAHRPLMADDPEEKWHAGELRTVQNWIGGSHRSPRGAVHVPPTPARVPGLMDDLVRFMRRTDLDPIVQAAVAHAQFESIHPFTDGNGRVGRSLINALWRYRSLTRQMAVPVASAIVAERERYFGLVNDYRDGHVEPFVLFLADATRRSAREATVSAERLRELPDVWQERVHARAGSAVETLLRLLPQHPVVDAGDVARLTGVSTARAYAAIGRLEEAGVLRRITESRRDMAWAAGDVLDEADLMMDRLRFA